MLHPCGGSELRQNSTLVFTENQSQNYILDGNNLNIKKICIHVEALKVILTHYS